VTRLLLVMVVVIADDDKAILDVVAVVVDDVVVVVVVGVDYVISEVAVIGDHEDESLDGIFVHFTRMVVVRLFLFLTAKAVIAETEQFKTLF
jgi:hypothetical protein